MRALIGAALTLGVLAGCDTGGTSQSESAAAPARVFVQDRYVVRESAQSFEATLSDLLEALDRRDLTVFAVIDHAAAAQGASLTLAPTTVVIFGNPKAGTALMKAEPVLGAELPLRGLVYEREGEVFLAMTGAANLGRTYPLDEQTAILDKIAQTLDEIANDVAGG